MGAFEKTFKLNPNRKCVWIQFYAYEAKKKRQKKLITLDEQLGGLQTDDHKAAVMPHSIKEWIESTLSIFVMRQELGSIFDAFVLQSSGLLFDWKIII